MYKKLVLLTLQTFSTTGGVQKMARTLGHSLNQAAIEDQLDFEMWSLYDSGTDLLTQYVPAEKFFGFGHNRTNFSLKILQKARSFDYLVLSHINLALVGLVIKMLNPKCRILLIAHGIEVWRPLSGIKKMLLSRCDGIICVSHFTKAEMIKRHQCDPDSCFVINNSVDPFIKLPDDFLKPPALLKRYGLDANSSIIFTLTRLAYTEQYKGYEQVIKAISKLKTGYPEIKYILAGAYDKKEESRIRKLITDYWVTENVILTGFIDEKELTDHFLLADVFVLPSKKEGFGIVFIEALACGLPVICGNADGSIDAIRNGELGKAVNADNVDELTNAINDRLAHPLTLNEKQLLQAKCMDYFSETDYIKKLQAVITGKSVAREVYNE